MSCGGKPPIILYMCSLENVSFIRFRMRSLILALLLCGCALADMDAGAGREDSSAKLASVSEERITLSYFMANHKTMPFTAEDLTIAELQRRTNVSFDIESIDSGYWDKYKMLLASNDLPD